MTMSVVGYTPEGYPVLQQIEVTSWATSSALLTAARPRTTSRSTTRRATSPSRTSRSGGSRWRPASSCPTRAWFRCPSPAGERRVFRYDVQPDHVQGQLRSRSARSVCSSPPCATGRPRWAACSLSSSSTAPTSRAATLHLSGMPSSSARPTLRHPSHHEGSGPGVDSNDRRPLAAVTERRHRLCDDDLAPVASFTESPAGASAPVRTGAFRRAPSAAHFAA